MKNLIVASLSAAALSVGALSLNACGGDSACDKFRDCCEAIAAMDPDASCDASSGSATDVQCEAGLSAFVSLYEGFGGQTAPDICK